LAFVGSTLSAAGARKSNHGKDCGLKKKPFSNKPSEASTVEMGNIIPSQINQMGYPWWLKMESSTRAQAGNLT